MIDVSEKIRIKEGINPDQQVLLFNGLKLEMGSTVEDYNIQEHFKGHNPLIGPEVCLHRNDPVSYFEYVDERRFLNSALKFIMSEIRSCAKNMKEKEHY